MKEKDISTVSDTKNNKAISLPLIGLCIILLVNPNINIFDPLPDFIAWFILAHIANSGVGIVPYFEEAKSSFIRLGVVNLLKVPAIIIVFLIRMSNTADTDIYALAALVFAAAEAIFVVSAIKNTFDALFYLGERTSLRAAITPFKVVNDSDMVMSPESLRAGCYVFAIIKCGLYVLPEIFRLSQNNLNPTVTVNFIKYYPLALIIALLIGLVAGILWYSRIRLYAKSVFVNNGYERSIDELMSHDPQMKLRAVARATSSTLGRSMTFFIVGAIFTIELVFENFNRVDVMPRMLYPLFFILAIYGLKDFVPKAKHAARVGIVFSCLTLASCIIQAIFLSKYSYLDLLENTLARKSYLYLEIISVFELIVAIAFLIMMFFVLRRFVLECTGVSPMSERYTRSDGEYHKMLVIRGAVFTGIGIITAILKCLKVFVNANVKIIENANGQDIITTVIPYFSLILTVASLIYIAYAMYYCGLLKTEMRIKFEK